MSDSPIIQLYSASPRRHYLMKSVGLPFGSVPVHADETVPKDMSGPEAVLTVARRKIEAGIGGSDYRRRQWGLTADSLVEGRTGLLGKPENESSACAMLAELSSGRHWVHTAMVLYAPPTRAGESEGSDGKTLEEVHSTEVVFRSLTQSEIRRYAASGEWRGASGAYRIQGRGAFLVESISGLWSTVVGLPLGPLYGMLTAASYPFG